MTRLTEYSVRLCIRSLISAILTLARTAMPMATAATIAITAPIFTLRLRFFTDSLLFLFKKNISSGQVQDGFRHAGQRGDAVHGAEGDRLARHAEDHAARLVLGDRRPSRALQVEHAPGAVLAHPGQEHADRVAARAARRRLEQQVDRGTVARHERALLHFHAVAGAAAAEQEMMVPGGGQDAPRLEDVLVLR